MAMLESMLLRESSDTESQCSEKTVKVQEQKSGGSTENKKRGLETSQAENILKKKKTIKRKEGLSTLCYKFLSGRCRFKDCAFRHVTLDEITLEDHAEILKDVRWKKEYDPKLAEVVQKFPITFCRAFKEGVCTRGDKCRYWHMDTELKARWAGFKFYCGPCVKGFTSEAQMREHESSKKCKKRKS
jgi:hypothetical protein